MNFTLYSVDICVFVFGKTVSTDMTRGSGHNGSGKGLSINVLFCFISAKNYNSLNNFFIIVVSQ